MSNAPLIWMKQPPQQPGQTPYYINTVAITANGERVVTGTYYHDYSSADARRGIVTPETIFGTYCYDCHGNLVWQDTWSGYEGVYWAATTPSGDWSASCGQYSHVPYRGFVFIYDANGNRNVSWTDAPSRVSIVQISASGTTCAAGGDAVYVFRRDAGGFGATPMIIELPPGTGGKADSVQGLAMDVTGSKIAVGTYQGRIILYSIADGLPATIGQYMGTLSVHAIAMNWVGSCFVAGTGNGEVLYFDVEQFATSNAPTWTTTLKNAAGTQAASVYGAAINREGTLASAVGNIGSAAGVLGLLNLATSGGSWAWTADTEHNPNSTSMNGDGSLISVADGHPDGTPGAFYAFSSAAPDPAPKTALWIQASGNMSWPMQIASSGNAAVAGSDDGYVYYFRPVSG
jgi:hypothetical protein